MKARLTPEGEWAGHKFRLILFVAGNERNSMLARENLNRICSDHLNDNYDLQIVDVFENFDAAVEYDIFLTPALLVVEPQPPVTIIGNLSNTQTVLSIMRIEER